MNFFPLVTLCLFAVGAEDKAPRYPRAELLLEAAELLRPGGDKGLRILDARSRDKYDAGHIPGAVWVDHAAWSKQFASGQDAEAWAKRIGALGVDLATPLVLYDDILSRDAARIWWILRYWGAKEVRLLNGGWSAWQEVGGPVSKEASTPEPKTPILKPQIERLTTKKDLLDLLGKRSHQVIDARSFAEHCGEEKMAKRAGAIPGAIHREWTDVLDRKTQRFKSAEELAKMFRDQGLRLDRPSITYCQSGGRAAVLAFALELMGGQSVSNYYRSWAEWGNADDTPIVKPEGKKEK